MPGLPDVPQVLRLDIKHTEGADPSLGNRTFWKYSGGAITNAQANDLAAATAGAWSTHLASLCIPAVALNEVVITDLTTTSSARGIWTGSTVGTRSGAELPINDVALLNFTLNRRYRGGKPRTYNPWGAQPDLTSSQKWGSSFITECETKWAAFVAEWQAFSEGSMVIGSQANVSYYSGFASVQNPVTKRWSNIPTPRVAPVVDVIVTTTLNPIVGSQRRRLRA